MSKSGLYQVTAVNMSNVGGGGSDRDRTTNYWQIVTDDSLDEIKANCEKNYRENTKHSPPSDVVWHEYGAGNWSSNDLSSVMYYIKPVNIVSSS